jgi:hypothetical protein
LEKTTKALPLAKNQDNVIVGDYRKSSKKPKLQVDDGVDLGALAQMIADSVSKNIKIPEGQVRNITYAPDGSIDDSFDATSSLSQLADSMLVQRGDKSSNFEDLGGVKKTKKDEKATNKTIDLLSDLED